jgi:hypothetical protein
MALKSTLPLFVSPESVIERMQLTANLEGMRDVVADAIQGAISQVEGLLGCTIVRKSQDCMYYLDGDAFSGIQPNGVFKLEVPSGLIRKDTPVVVSYSGSLGNDLGISIISPDLDGPFGDTILADPAYHRVNYDRGIILMDARRYRDRYVRVQCDTGYEPGTNPLPITGLPVYDPATTYNQGDKVAYNTVAYEAIVQSTGNLPTNVTYWKPSLIPMEMIPNELYEAIVSYVPSVFDAAQATNRNQQAQPLYKIAQDRAQVLLKGYIRMEGFMFRPIWS